MEKDKFLNNLDKKIKMTQNNILKKYKNALKIPIEKRKGLEIIKARFRSAYKMGMLGYILCRDEGTKKYMGYCGCIKFGQKPTAEDLTKASRLIIESGGMLNFQEANFFFPNVGIAEKDFINPKNINEIY